MMSGINRYTNDSRCPVCGGANSDPQGKGVRCWGGIYPGSEWAICTRIASRHAAGHSGGWSHLIDGDCSCRAVHGSHAPIRLSSPQRDRINHVGPLLVSERGERGGKITYRLIGPSGEHIANHVRIDRTDGSKEMYYTLPDGTNGLGGRAQTSLPLYGVHELIPEAGSVVVTEGEKARDALASRGVLSVGTACGAGAVSKDGKLSPRLPDDESLRPLLSVPSAVLWPDNDEVGRAHMEVIGSALLRLGHQDVRLVEWPDAPKKGDAADFTGDDEALRALITHAPIYTPSVTDPVVSGGALENRLKLTPASSITPKITRWTWDTNPDADRPADAEGRFPEGALVAAVGRAGVGKSQFACWLSAQVTRGTLPGSRYGEPRSVIYVATEDSWERTLVPRLMAAGADLDRVFRLEVSETEGGGAVLSLPQDTAALGEHLGTGDFGLFVADPLLSIIGDGIDDYRAKEVRSALEPLVQVLDRHGVLGLALAHFTKASGSDPLMLISGSGAFGQLFRAAVGFARDEEQDAFVLSQIKNNLGREDVPSLAYTIEPTSYETPEGTGWTSRLSFIGESNRSVRDILRDVAGDNANREAQREIDGWLADYLAASGGSAAAQEANAAAKPMGWSPNQLSKARIRIGARSQRLGFGKDASYVWSLDAPAGLMDAMDSRVQNRASMASMQESMVQPEPAPASESETGSRSVTVPNPFACDWCEALLTGYTPEGKPTCDFHTDESNRVGAVEVA